MKRKFTIQNLYGFCTFLLLGFMLIGCNNPSSSNNTSSSKYAQYSGVWLYTGAPQNMKIILESDSTFIWQNYSAPNYNNAAKGTYNINGSNIVLNITHVCIPPSTVWSNSAADLAAATVWFGGSLSLNGTINGSRVGSIITINTLPFIKQ